MNDALVPKSVAEDDDDVVVALETARVEEERGDKSEAARWLQRAASAARKQGRPERAGEVSRLAARLTGHGSSTPPPPDTFEPLPGETQVLSDADEDFSDKTIVDALPRPVEPPRAAPPVTSADVALPRPPSVPRRAPALAHGPVLTGPTPVAPQGPRAGAPHPAVRVAVRKILGGRLEARPLEADEAPIVGEEEALLVAVRPGAKLF